MFVNCVLFWAKSTSVSSKKSLHQVSSPRPNQGLWVSFTQPVLLSLMCSPSHFPLGPWFPCSMHQNLYFLFLICLCTYSTALTFCSLPSTALSTTDPNYPVSCPTYFAFSPAYSSVITCNQ